MTTNILSSTKSAAWVDKLDNMGGSTILPAALGLLGGGAIGYMTGKDANKLTGEKSTRLRNALIGSLLGGSTAGLGGYFLSKRLYDYNEKFEDAFSAYQNKRDRLIDDIRNAWEKRREERKREEQRKSIEKKASGPYSIDDDFSIIKSFNGYIPTLIGILGGGSTGYFFSKDEDKKNKLINTLLGATAGGSIGLLGTLLGARYEIGSSEKDRYNRALKLDPAGDLDFFKNLYS